MDPGRVIIQSGLVSAIIAVVFLFFALSDTSFPKRIGMLFRFSAGILTLLVVSDGLNIFAGFQPHPSALSYITDTVGYIFRALLLFTVSLVISKRSRFVIRLASIPLLLNALVVLLNVFFPGLVFSYSPDNEFIRGALGWVPFAIPAFYMLLMLLWSIDKYRRRGSKDFLIVMAMLAAVSGALYLEVCRDYEFMTVGSSAVCCVFYYLYLHIQIYSHDALTEAFDRRSFFLDAEKLKRSGFLIISLDVNNLKDINDRSGHAAGDRALCTIVDTMRRFLLKKSTIYRVGGDEFEVICQRSTVNEAESMMRAFETALSKTPYGAAYGIAVYSPGMTVEEVCEVADKDMYMRKFNMKHPD